MKQTLLTLSFLALTLSGFSQLLVDVVTSEGTSDADKIAMDIKITNRGTETVDFYWDLIRTGTFPDEWQIQVCDCHTCYMWGFESGACDAACTLLAGEEKIFYVYINPNGVIADGKLEFKLLDICGDENSLLVGSELTYLVSEPSSSSSFSEASSLIFPNPTFNSFQISDDQNIESISLYNMIGTELLEAIHTEGKKHDISNLDNGIYLVRMVDRDNEVTEVLKLTKN